jgi:hypothetical protein
MTFLHPEAQALIDAANRGEEPMPVEAFERVHRSILWRATMFGPASAVAKIVTKFGRVRLREMALGVRFASFGLITAAAGAALISVAPVWRSEPHVAWVSATVTRASHTTSRAVVRSESQARESGLPSPAVAETAPALTETAPALTETPPASMGAATDPVRTAEAAAPAAPRTPRASAPFARTPALTHRSDGLATPRAMANDDAPFANASPSAIVERTAALPDPKLARELDVLHRVHAALGEGRPQFALELLDSDEARWDGAVLEEQARAARVTALCQLDRHAEASAAIDQFRSSWPRSLLSERMRGGCRGLIGEAGTARQPER